MDLRRDLGLTYIFISHNLASVLTPEPGLGIPDTGLGATPPDPLNVPPGCPLHPRCPQAFAPCAGVAPRSAAVGGAGDPSPAISTTPPRAETQRSVAWRRSRSADEGEARARQRGPALAPH